MSGAREKPKKQRLRAAETYLALACSQLERAEFYLLSREVKALMRSVEEEMKQHGERDD